MKFLSEVRRFGMAVMFLSAKDKEGGFVDTLSYEVQLRYKNLCCFENLKPFNKNCGSWKLLFCGHLRINIT